MTSSLQSGWSRRVLSMSSISTITLLSPLGWDTQWLLSLVIPKDSELYIWRMSSSSSKITVSFNNIYYIIFNLIRTNHIFFRLHQRNDEGLQPHLSRRLRVLPIHSHFLIRRKVIRQILPMSPLFVQSCLDSMLIRTFPHSTKLLSDETCQN